MAARPLRSDFTSVPVSAMPASITSPISELNRALRLSATILRGRSFCSAIVALNVLESGSERAIVQIGRPPKENKRHCARAAGDGQFDLIQTVVILNYNRSNIIRNILSFTNSRLCFIIDFKVL